jgi:hypothetical protein
MGAICNSYNVTGFGILLLSVSTTCCMTDSYNVRFALKFWKMNCHNS